MQLAISKARGGYESSFGLWANLLNFRQPAVDQKQIGHMLGACCPTNVGDSALPREFSAQVKLLESVVADESITEELCAFLHQIVFGERQLRQRAISSECWS